MQADYPDHGVDAPNPRVVEAALHKEIQLGMKYGARFNFGKMVLHTAEGEDFEGDLNEFAAVRINIDCYRNVTCMKSPILWRRRDPRAICTSYD